jgi:hypothetical protein
MTDFARLISNHLRWGLYIILTLNLTGLVQDLLFPKVSNDHDRPRSPEVSTGFVVVGETSGRVDGFEYFCSGFLNEYLFRVVSAYSGR